MCSRPRRLPRTRPALDSTSRCFLTAWRETGDRSLRREIDSGPLEASRTRSRRRVSSPSAANSGAASLTCPVVGLAGDMAPDVLHLDRPAFGVHAERLVAATCGQPVEAGLDDGELRAFRRLLEPELDERRRLLRVVDLDVDRGRVPAEREEPLGVDLLDAHAERQVLVAGIGDLARDVLARGEARIELDAEP